MSLKWSSLSFFQTKGKQPQLKKLWNEYLSIRIKRSSATNDNTIISNLKSNSNDISVNNDSYDSNDCKDYEGSNNSSHELEELAEEYELLYNFLDVLIIEHETMKDEIRSILNFYDDINHEAVLQLCNKVQLIQSEELIDIIESIFCHLLDFVLSYSAIHMNETSLGIKELEDNSKKLLSNDKDIEKMNIIRSLIVLYNICSDKSQLRNPLVHAIENKENCSIINNLMKAINTIKQPTYTVFLIYIINFMNEFPVVSLLMIKGNIINNLLSMFDCTKNSAVRSLIIDLIKTMLPKYRNLVQIQDLKPNELNLDKESNIITYNGFEKTYTCTGHSLTHGRTHKQSPKIQGNGSKTFAERGFSIAFNVMSELLKMTPWINIDENDKEVVDAADINIFKDIEMRAIPLDMLISESADIKNAMHSTYNERNPHTFDLNINLVNSLLLSRLDCADLESFVESMNTIYDVLFGNVLLQKEFGLGYQKIVDSLFIIDSNDKLENADFSIIIKKLLSIITNTVCRANVDGDPALFQGCSISNIYAVVMLKYLINSGKYRFLVMAVNMIKILVRINPMNVVSLEESGIVFSLSEKLVNFICDASSINFEMDLIIDIVTIFQMISVATSNRDNNVILLFSQILIHISYSSQYQVNNQKELQRCSNCEMETAAFECIHETCICEGRIGLCFECDKVFHKSTAKRSHIRMPMIIDRAHSCLGSLNCQTSKNFCYISNLSASNETSNTYFQESLLLVFVCGLRGILDDHASRNQELLPALLETILLVFRKVVVLPMNSENTYLKANNLTQLVDPLNIILDDDEVATENLTGLSARRIIVLSLIKLLSRTLLPQIHIPYFQEEIDTSKKINNFPNILSIFRSYGGEALLSHLLLDDVSNETSTPSIRCILSKSDKQLIAWLFRELLVTAVELDQKHASSLIQWLVWLLSCPLISDKKITPCNIVVPKINSSIQSPNIDQHFAIVPVAYSAVSATTKLHLVQELQLLLAGEDNDNLVDEVRVKFSRSKNMSLLPLNNVSKTSRQQSFEFFSRDEISKTNSKDIDNSFSTTNQYNKSANRKDKNGNGNFSQLPLLYRTPCVCSIIQELFNDSNCIQALIHLVMGDLCHNGILVALLDGFIVSDTGSEILNEIDIEIWWQSLTLLIRLLCNNDKGKLIIDKYVGISTFVKTLLPLTESTFSVSSDKLGFFIKNDMSFAVVHFLIELCVCKSRIFPPTRPFVALCTQKFIDVTDDEKTKSGTNLISRPTLASYRVYTDLSEKFDEYGISTNSLVTLSPVYHAEKSYLKFINDVIRPKPLIFYSQALHADVKSSNMIISAIPASVQGSRKMKLLPVDSKETLGDIGEGSTVGSQTNLKYQKSSMLTVNSTSSIQHDTDSVNAWENESQGRNSHHSLLTLGQILLPHYQNTPPGSVNEEFNFKESQKLGLQEYENVSMTSESGAKYSSIEKNHIASSTTYFPLFDILDTYNEPSADTLLTIISEIMSVRAGCIYKADKRFNLLSTNTKPPTKKSGNSKDSSVQSSSSSDSGPSDDFMQIALKRQLFALQPSTKERKTSANWQPNFSRLSLRSIEHGLVLIAISLVTTDESQTLAFGLLQHLLAGNPYNSDLLFSSSERAVVIVNLLPFLNEKSRESMTSLLAQIFSHHADSEILNNLLKGAIVPNSSDDYKRIIGASENNNNDGKKKIPNTSRQLLQIMNQAAFVKAPYRYIHFDNSQPFKSRIMLPLLEKLPNSKVGITITSWLRMGCLGQCPTSALYQIAVNNVHNITVNVIDVYYRVVYKNSSKDCETTSNASGWSGYPNDLYPSDDSSKRSLQLCLSFSVLQHNKVQTESNTPNFENWETIIAKLYAKSNEADLPSKSNLQMVTLASAIVGNSLPDAIIDYEWAEAGDWQLLSIGLSDNGITCLINGVERLVLYWTPLGYRSMADTNGSYNNLYNPFESKELSMQMCVGGRFVEERAYSELLAKILGAKSDESKNINNGSCEGDIVNIYSKLVGGFSGTLSHLVTFEGAVDCSQQLNYFNQGPNGDISLFSNRRLINMSLPLFVKKEFEQIFGDDLSAPIQERSISPSSTPNILNTQNKSKSKRPDPFPITFVSNPNTQTSRVSDLFNIFGGSSSMLQKGEYDGKNYNLEFFGNLKVYEKISLLESIDKSGGLKVLYPLLVIDRIRQVEAIRIITAILQSSQTMFKLFFTTKQHNVLLYSLHSSPSITSVETIKEFFNLVCPVRQSAGLIFTSSDNASKNHSKFFTRPQILSLLFDIIVASPKKPQIARSMLDWLRESCDNISENCSIILELPSLLPILILLSLWSVSSYEPFFSLESVANDNHNMYQGSTEKNRLQTSCMKLIRILLIGTSGIYQKILSPTVNNATPTGFSVENLLLLIYFVQYSLRSALAEVDNVKVTPYLKHDSGLPIPFFGTNEHQNWSLNAALAAIDGILSVSDGPLFATISNMLKSTIAKDIWFHFLDLASSIHVSIRERAMRLICICMSLPNGEIDPKQVLIFEKLFGFEVLGEHLAFYAADENIVESLIAMMFWKLGPRPYGVGEANNQVEKTISDESKRFGDREPDFRDDNLISRSEDMDISAEYATTSQSEIVRFGTSPTEEINSNGLLSFFNWKNTKSLLTSESSLHLDQLGADTTHTLNPTILFDNVSGIDDNSLNDKNVREISFVSVAMESPENLELSSSRRRAARASSSNRRLLSPLSAALLGHEDEGDKVYQKSPARRRRSIPSIFLLDDAQRNLDPQQKMTVNPTSSTIPSEGHLILPQALYSLMKVLQTSQRSDIILKACGCLERALLVSIGGEVKVNMRNLETLISQKDWLIWMCNSVIFLRKKIRSNANVLNSYANDQFSDSESIGDYKSESGMESEDSRDRSRGTADPNAVVEEHFTSPVLDLIRTILILVMEQKATIANKCLSEVFRLPAPDANEVQSDLIFDILDAIDSCALRPTEATFHLLKNFNSFLEQIIEKVDMGIDICARVLQTIQAIGYRAPPDIRSRIKEIGLHETRNVFVCSCLIEYSGLVDRDKENYDRVALWMEVQPSLYAYLSASESKQLNDNQVIVIILGIFMECTEDFDSISQVNPQESPEIDVSVLLERLQIILTVLEALIVIIQGCASVSSDCNKCLVRIFTDLVGDSKNFVLSAFAYNFKSSLKSTVGVSTISTNNTNSTQQYPSTKGLTLNNPFESAKEGDESKSWWSWTSQPPHPTSLHNELTSAHSSTLNTGATETIDVPTDARSFLDWYCSPDRRQLYKEIKQRMARDLIPTLKQNEKLVEKNAQRRSKHLKALQDKNQKDKLVLTKGMNESSNKSKVVGNAGYKECNESMKIWINGLNERIEKGKKEFDEQNRHTDNAEPTNIPSIPPDLRHYLQHDGINKSNEYEMRRAMDNTMEFLKRSKE